MIAGNGVSNMTDNILNNNSPIMPRVRYSPPGHLPTLSENGKVGREDRQCSTSSAYMETSSSWNPELMSGSLTLMGPGNKHSQSVQVKVYRTSLEHFAVVYPQKKVCRPLGVLNLRNAHVERLLPANNTAKISSGDQKDGVKSSSNETLGFVVRQRGFDSPFCLTFLLETPYVSPYSPFSAPPRRDLAKDLEQWMAAFRCSNSPGNSPASPPASPNLSSQRCTTCAPATPRSRRCNAMSKHPSCLAIVEEEEV